MGFNIIGIGEVLWDLLPSGPQLGGAPANFACHAQALGANALLISRIGNDSLGKDIVRRMESQGVSTRGIQIDSHAPTGTVTVELSADGQPKFTIHEGVAWDRIQLDDLALPAAKKAHAVCFGSLAQRLDPSRTTIQTLVAATPAESLRIFDINLRQTYYSREVIETSLNLANVLKLNDGELPVLASLLGLSGQPREQLQRLSQRFDLRLVALTRGAQGSLLYSVGAWADHPGLPVEVKDTVGAGDAFTATMTLGLLQGLSLNDLNDWANEVARYVCSCHGATPALPEELLSQCA